MENRNSFRTLLLFFCLVACASCRDKENPIEMPPIAFDCADRLMLHFPDEHHYVNMTGVTLDSPPTLTSSNNSVATVVLLIGYGCPPRAEIKCLSYGKTTITAQGPEGNNASIEVIIEPMSDSYERSGEDYRIQGVSREDSAAIAKDMAAKNNESFLTLEYLLQKEGTAELLDLNRATIYKGGFRKYTEDRNLITTEFRDGYICTFQLSGPIVQSTQATYWYCHIGSNFYLIKNLTEQYQNSYAGLVAALFMIKVPLPTIYDVGFTTLIFSDNGKVHSAQGDELSYDHTSMPLSLRKNMFGEFSNAQWSPTAAVVIDDKAIERTIRWEQQGYIKDILSPADKERILSLPNDGTIIYILRLINCFGDAIQETPIKVVHKNNYPN